MQRRAVTYSQRLALLVFAYAALAAHHASAHSASRLALSGERHIRTARHLHSADSSTAAANATSVPQIHSRKCGVAEVSTQQAQQVVGAIANNVALRQQGRAAPITINVYFHIVQMGADGDLANGWVSDAQLATQIAVLNAAYASLQVSFVAAGVQRLSGQSQWWNVDVNSDAAAAFKSASYQGNYADLNFWITMLQGGVLGATTLPWYGDSNQDGTIIHPYTMPGGLYNGYNLGNTAVHEIGHWMGLLHTFQGGCSEPNDGCTDTAQEAQPQFGCPVPAPNTCPGKPTSQPLLDPIHNFMDYSPDSCMNTFSSQQETRMGAAWDTYRASYWSASNVKDSALGGSGSAPATQPAAAPTPKPLVSQGETAALIGQLSPAPAPKPKPTPKPKPSPPPPKRRPPPPPPRKRPPPPAAKARNAKKAPTKKATPKTAANQRLSRLAQALKAKIAAKKPARG